MKRILVFVLGLLIGFVLAEPLPGGRNGSLSAPPTRQVAPVTADGRSDSAEGGPRTSEPIAATAPNDREVSEVPAPKPSADRPSAFLFIGGGVPLYWPEGTPPALTNNPEFEALLRQVLRSNFRSSLAFFRLLVPLDNDQFNALLDVAVDQNLPTSFNERNRDPQWSQRSDVARQRLAGVLSEVQLERLAQLNRLTGPAFNFFDLAAEEPAAQGLVPLTSEQASRLLEPTTWHNPNPGRPQDPYAVLTVKIRSDDSTLTVGQRDYLEKLQRLQDDLTLLNQVQWAKVRDPDVWEIWPED